MFESEEEEKARLEKESQGVHPKRETGGRSSSSREKERLRREEEEREERKEREFFFWKEDTVSCWQSKAK